MKIQLTTFACLNFSTPVSIYHFSEDGQSTAYNKKNLHGTQCYTNYNYPNGSLIKVPSGTEVVTLRLKKRSNDFWLVVLEKKI